MKHWKVCVSFALVFALLGGAYFAIRNYEPKDDTANPNSIAKIQVLAEDVNQLQEIRVENQTESFAFTKTEQKWVVAGKEQIDLYAARVESLCFSAANLTADTLIARECDDYAVYGLDHPQARVELNKINGETVDIEVGNQTPAGDGYYAKISLAPAVYKISQSLGAQFCSPLTFYRMMTINLMEISSIKTVKITQKGVPFIVTYQTPPQGTSAAAFSGWKITSPISKEADHAQVQELLLKPLSQIVAVDVASDDAGDKGVYGFTGDTVEISTDTETVRFEVGAKDGKSYICPEGKQTIYAMGDGILPFMKVTAFDVLEKMTNLISIDEIESVSISMDGVEAFLEISHRGDRTLYTVNNMPADEKAFKNFYLELSALTVDGMVDKTMRENEGKPFAKIVYTFTDKRTTTLAYYPYDDFNFAVFENGENIFYIKKTKLSDLKTITQAFIRNPKG